MPKGDVDNLRADIDDGYTRMANLLLEMLACSPLAASELRVMMFIARRTYGWAKKSDRASGKLSGMNGDDIARGTGLPVKTARNALTALVKQRLILQVSEAHHPGAKCFYGINPDCSTWGSGGDWREARVAHREAKHCSLYIPEKWGIAFPENGEQYSPNSGKSVPLIEGMDDGLKSTGTGVPGAPTDSITGTTTEEGQRHISEACMKRHPDHAMILQNYCRLRDTVVAIYGKHWTPTQVDDFTVDVGAAIDEPGCTVSEQDAIDALEGDSKPTPGRRGDWWVGDLCKARAAMQREAEKSLREAEKTYPAGGPPPFDPGPDLTDAERAAAEETAAQVMAEFRQARTQEAAAAVAAREDGAADTSCPARQVREAKS